VRHRHVSRRPFVDERYITETLPLAQARGVGTICFKTFGAGKLLGDTTGYNQPLQLRPRGKLSSGGVDDAVAVLPRLTVSECLHYTLTLDPDVALLGLSFPNEQDQAPLPRRSRSSRWTAEPDGGYSVAGSWRARTRGRAGGILTRKHKVDVLAD
jgi:hypothetical protein